MVNYSNNRPIVKIGQNKNILKEYKSNNLKKVYINDNSFFEILLKNPTNKTVGAIIKINGEYLSDAYIVLYPGQSVWLDGNPITKKKLFFKTYNIKNNIENVEAIKNNGLVDVYLYEEATLTTFLQVNYSNWYNNDGYYNKTVPNKYDVTYTSNTSANNIKTGRVIETGESDMNFESIGINFNPFSSYQYNFKLEPISNKSVLYVKDVSKTYCSNCGRRKRKGENYCPKCGTKF